MTQVIRSSIYPSLNDNLSFQSSNDDDYCPRSPVAKPQSINKNFSSN